MFPLEGSLKMSVFFRVEYWNLEPDDMIRAVSGLIPNLFFNNIQFREEKNNLFASYPQEIIILMLASTGQLTCLFPFIIPAKFDMRQARKRAMLPQWGVFVLL